MKRGREMLEVAGAVEEDDRELVSADGVECDVMSETACVDGIDWLKGSRVNIVFVAGSVMMVTACWRGGECPNLPRRRCLFGHSAGEVAAALLVGSEAPRDDVLELADEVQEQRLVGAVVWDRASLAATAAAKPNVEARPPEIAKDSALTGSVFRSVTW